jgi:hypothetical protein
MTVHLRLGESEKVYTGSAYLPAALMMMFSACLLLWAELPAGDKHHALLAAPIAASLVWFAAMGRAYLADWVRQLSYQERSAMALLAAVAFIMPSVVLGRSALLAGLLVLHIPGCLGLVSASGFAQAYLLTGLSLIFVSHLLSEAAALVAWASYLLLFCVTCCSEHYLHTFRAQSHGLAGNPTVPIRIGLARFALAASLTLPLGLLTPALQPVRGTAGAHGLNRPASPAVGAPLLDLSSPNFLYAVLGLFAILMLSALMLWLVRRLRNDAGEAVVGADDAPMETPVIRPLHRERQPRRHPTGTREQIVRLYAQMSEALTALNLGRGPDQTPMEYGHRLALSGRVPAGISEEMTQAFIKARYAAEEPAQEDVEYFRKLVRRIVADSSARRP